MSGARSGIRAHGDALSNGIGRGTVQSVDDTQLMQEATHNLFGDTTNQEAHDTIEYAHDYGFTNVVMPPTGEGANQKSAESFTAYVSGNRSHGVNMKHGDRRYRLFKLENGEVAMHDDQGHQVHFARDGIWASAPNSKKIQLQIMESDKKPPGDKNNDGQTAQKKQKSIATCIFDKGQFTLNHPEGAVAFTCKTFTVNASSDIKLISATNALLKGAAAILYAVKDVFLKAASGNINAKAAVLLLDDPEPWTPGAADPPVSG